MSNVRMLLLICFALLCLNACSFRLDKVEGIPLPVPTAEKLIHSDKYFEDQGYEIKDVHKLENSIERNKALDDKNPVIYGKRIQTTNGIVKKDLTIHYYDYLESVEVVGGNRYSMAVHDIHPITRQDSDVTCWAHCIKNLLLYQFGEDVPIEGIISRAKGELKYEAADILEIFYTMGFTDLTTSSGSPQHLLKALARQEPVMLGYKDKDIFHAVVVVGAEFSFVDTKPVPDFLTLSVSNLLERSIPFVDLSEDYAFRSYTIADPADGKIKTLAANELEGKINFLISFREKKL